MSISKNLIKPMMARHKRAEKRSFQVVNEHLSTFITTQARLQRIFRGAQI